MGQERRPGTEEYLMYFQRTQVLIPAPMVVGSQLPVTPGPDDAVFFFGFFSHMHICGMHTDIHINKAKNKYF